MWISKRRFEQMEKQISELHCNVQTLTDTVFSRNTLYGVHTIGVIDRLNAIGRYLGIKRMRRDEEEPKMILEFDIDGQEETRYV